MTYILKVDLPFFVQGNAHQVMSAAKALAEPRLEKYEYVASRGLITLKEYVPDEAAREHLKSLSYEAHLCVPSEDHTSSRVYLRIYGD